MWHKRERILRATEGSSFQQGRQALIGTLSAAPNKGDLSVVSTDLAQTAKPTPANAAARLLVVDDDPLVLRFLVRGLESVSFLVDTAVDGNEAMTKLSSCAYDVLLSDVNLPNCSGIDLLKESRKLNPQSEVILITGKPDLSDAVSSGKLGAFDYLAKPISLTDLRGKVQAAVEAQKARGKRALERTAVLKDVPTTGYRVVRSLGCGTMGTVLLVERAGCQYAMKILRGADTDLNSRKRLERFQREGEIISQIDHPGVVRVFETGYDPDLTAPYIVMEYVAGHPLSKLIEKPLLNEQTKLSLIVQIAQTLSVVHRHGILHRDVKPANVLVTHDDVAKLTDFGIARLGESTLTQTSELMGSPAYMSPESFEDVHGVDHRSDIFSLGTLSFELLTGEKPFVAQTLAGMINEIMSSEPPLPSSICAGLPLELDDILMGMLRKDPAERYQNASEIARDLCVLIG